MFNRARTLRTPNTPESCVTPSKIHSLKYLRQLAGLSQEALGRKLSEALPESGSDAAAYAQPRISAYENGRNRISISVAQVLMTILNKELKRQKLSHRATLDSMLHPNFRVGRKQK